MKRILLLALLMAWGAGFTQAESVALTLADNGRAHYPIVVSTGATERVRALAEDLAGMMKRITGATFSIEEAADATSGIQLGVGDDFAHLPADFVFAPDQPLSREAYRIRTHAQGMWIIGATEQAVSHAVWGFLDGLGYRLFFLTDTWEVVPEIPTLRVARDTFDSPDFHTRQAPRGAPWSNNKLWQRWHTRNRTSSAFSLSTGHAYGGIIRANREVFAQHPEFYALVNGARLRDDGVGNSKLCIGNPELRRMVVDYAVRTMQANPERESISMDPTDGGGWCECDACAAIGSPSDRALLLANEVAVGINTLGLGPRYVGIYAYNAHSPPPQITAHPNVIVSVATHFIRGGFTLEQLIEGWRKQGATLGIRDYHDVFTWSHDMPRRARGGKLAYLQRTIPYFYCQGGRFMNSENADSWGANGLGYWVSPRLLWNISEADRMDALVDDFTTRAFGPAAEPMRAFYRLLNQDASLQTAEHVVALMYRDLAAARELAARRPDVMARLDDLVLYTRYCELYNAYRQAAGGARQAGFEAVLRHAYRIRDRFMLSTVAIYSRERYRDRAVVMPEDAVWEVPEAKNPWKDSTPFSVAEINQLLLAGIASNQPVVLDFEPVGFSDRLVPATTLTLPKNLESGVLPLKGRRLRKFLLWYDQPRELTLDVTGGLIAHYRDRGAVKIRLFAEQEATLDPVAQDESVLPDGVTRTVKLTSPHAGLHILEVSDGSDMTSLTIPKDMPLTVFSSQDERANLGERWTLYCYVPRGTKVFGGYTTSTTGRLCDSSGQVVFDFTTLTAAGYFSIPVAAGQDGTFWRFEHCRGERLLMTIPPYLAAHPSRLLLPEEVVQRDAKPADQLP